MAKTVTSESLSERSLKALTLFGNKSTFIILTCEALELGGNVLISRAG